jgi:transcriptional regulator with XRE-family HTH domain
MYDENDVTAPIALTKEQFGRRLYKLMLSRGMIQADLARASGMGRDAISTYVTGRSFPSPDSLNRIAKALNVEADVLLPNQAISAIERDAPIFEIKVGGGDPTKAHLKIDQMVSVTTALKVAELIKSDGEPSE